MEEAQKGTAKSLAAFRLSCPPLSGTPFAQRSRYDIAKLAIRGPGRLMPDQPTGLCNEPGLFLKPAAFVGTDPFEGVEAAFDERPSHKRSDSVAEPPIFPFGHLMPSHSHSSGV
jgi:hypothetical protein